ncbi:hypothetical protein AAG906_040009 [Vitis piasezkii]
MGDTGIITNSGDPLPHIGSIITTLTNQMTKALSKVRDVLQMCPFPSIEQAYAHVHMEALRQVVMSNGDPNNTSGAVLASKGLKLSSTTSHPVAVSNQPIGKSTTSSKSRTVPNAMKYNHHGNQRHTTESSQDEGPVSDIGNFGSNLVTSSCDVDHGAWLLDSGATDHMTFAATNFTTKSPPRRTNNWAGTKMGGLYYMEDVSVGHAHHIQSDEREQEGLHSLISHGSSVRWFVILLMTRMTWLYLMKHKDEVLHVFQSFHFFALIMMMTMLINASAPILNTMDSFMRHHVLRPLSKMA